MTADLCGRWRRRGDVLELTIVGNPIMHHLFLGLDPTELGPPFASRPTRPCIARLASSI